MLQSKKSSRPERSADLKVVSTQKELPEKVSQNFLSRLLVFLFLSVALVLMYHIIAGDRSSPIIINEKGEEVLAPERQAKLDKELEELDDAQQYALIALVDGYYPCYTCPNGTTTIFLYKDEVWKYGITRKGEEIRYPKKSYGAVGLGFITQFKGDYLECLKEEKIKIYNYPLLTEALKRNIRLFRPPGNSYDS